MGENAKLALGGKGLGKRRNLQSAKFRTGTGRDRGWLVGYENIESCMGGELVVVVGGIASF